MSAAAKIPGKEGKERNYKALGFMCGLEIHQRLATSSLRFPLASDRRRRSLK